MHARGLFGIELIISDDHAGLKAARKAVFPGVPMQRCQFHFAQNAQHYAPKISMREEIAAAVGSIFSQQKVEDARAQAARVAEEFRATAPKFSVWLESDVEECFSVYAFPEAWRKRLRTVNQSELLNREVRRGTRLVGIFPNQQALLRLAGVLLAEIHEDWIMQPVPFINMKLRSQQELQNVNNNNSEIYRKKVA